MSALCSSPWRETESESITSLCNFILEGDATGFWLIQKTLISEHCRCLMSEQICFGERHGLGFLNFLFIHFFLVFCFTFLPLHIHMIPGFLFCYSSNLMLINLEILRMLVSINNFKYNAFVKGRPDFVEHCQCLQYHLFNTWSICPLSPSLSVNLVCFSLSCPLSFNLTSHTSLQMHTLQACMFAHPHTYTHALLL